MMPHGWLVLLLAAHLTLVLALERDGPASQQGLGRVLTVNAHGRAGAPGTYGSIADALAAAQPGDEVRLSAGSYAEPLVSVRGGLAGRPIIISGAPARNSTIRVRGRVATITHPHVELRHLVLDGDFGPDDTLRVGDAADHLALRDVVVRRAGRDCVDIGSPSDVLIEDSSVHDCLNPSRGRTDAHGIVAGTVRRLTVRRTEVHTFSGDAIQLDPSRSAPGWTDLRIEACRFWLAPLRTPRNGFAAGAVPGENALDTKTVATGGRASVTIVDSDAWGFRGDGVTHAAAFNLKERVDVVADRVTVRESHIGFRVRGPQSSGAAVTLRNVVVHDVDTAIRYEDDISQLRVHHMTAGRNVGRLFQRASSASTRVDVRNLLVLGVTLPPEADQRGLAVDASAFVDAASDDYQLAAGSKAIDRGTPVDGVGTDRAGQRRPQGAAPDVGAFEFCGEACLERSPRPRPR
ncbi:MAG TPA: choice-of-anchor Q domain-containing protein [Luteitalea sp.]|nr:choice-of-anchor Q domain-containing protein [Luteitalea sp.]